MNREQAINYLRSSGMINEQIESVCEGLGCNVRHWTEKEFTGRTGDGRIFIYTKEVCSGCEGEVDKLTEFCPYCGAYIIKGEEK